MILPPASRADHDRAGERSAACRLLAFALAVATACWAVPLNLRAVQAPIRVTFVAQPDGERTWTSLVEEGVKFGISEARRTARLLDREVTLHPMREQSGEPDFTVSAGPERVTVRPRGTPPCIFDIRVRRERRAAAFARWTSGEACSGCPDAPRRSSAVRILEWHPTLDRFGASELNERFRRSTGSSMTAPAWLGWVAVKASVETALRSGVSLDCDTLARARFDGHKGRPLTFDRLTRELVQPLYIVSGANGRERVIGEIDSWQPSAQPTGDRGSR
jgi:hypothetical protein